MLGVPCFIEVISSAKHENIQVCRKLMAMLFKEKIAPLPFASTAQEVAGVLDALKARGITPAIFVINTFFAEELLMQVDDLIGPTPVVFMRRQIFADPLATKLGASGSARPGLTMIQQKMTSRPFVTWVYGSQIADEVAAEGAHALLRFLREGDFAILESYAQMQTIQMMKSRSESEIGPVRRKSGPVSLPSLTAL